MPRGSILRLTWVGLTLIAAVAFSASACLAQSQPDAPPRVHARSVGPAPPQDDVPPRIHARGGFDPEPLSLSISGLKSGLAEVQGGVRIFGVCWFGGDGPFEVRVKDQGGQLVVDEAEIPPGSQELILASKPLRLSVGDYVVDVEDHAGDHAVGRFRVRPAAPAALAAKGAGVMTDPELADSYEAYLRLLPIALSGGDAGAIHEMGRLCHRS